MTRAEQRSVNLTLQIIASSHPDTAETARRLSAVGTITTVIGNPNKRGNSGDGGLATDAAMFSPETIVFDASGNSFVSDYDSNVVRMVSKKTGLISTVAGNGVKGYSGNGGQATAAKLAYPTGLAFDMSGNLYIACADSHVIQKVDMTSGIISTFAGTASGGFNGDNIQAAVAQLNNPHGLAIDKDHLYISDTDNHRIRMIVLSTGLMTTIIGNGNPGYKGDGSAATDAEIVRPMYLAVNPLSGDVYIADSTNNRIRWIEFKTGIMHNALGEGPAGFYGDNGQLTDGDANSAYLNLPIAMLFDPLGNMYVSDSINRRIRKLVFGRPAYLTTVAGTGVYAVSGDGGLATSAQIKNPSGLAMDKAGNIYYAERDTGVIRSFSTIAVHRSIDFLGCANLVLQAKSDITFGGAHTAITGDIGISPGTSITGDYAISNNGVAHVNEGPSLTCAKDMGTIAAQAAALPCMNIPAELGKDNGAFCVIAIFCSVDLNPTLKHSKIILAHCTAEQIIPFQVAPHSSLVCTALHPEHSS